MEGSGRMEGIVIKNAYVITRKTFVMVFHDSTSLHYWGVVGAINAS